MTPILELTGTYSRRSRSKCTYLCSRLARIVRCRAAVSKIDVHSDGMDPDGCTGKSNKDEHGKKKKCIPVVMLERIFMFWVKK